MWRDFEEIDIYIYIFQLWDLSYTEGLQGTMYDQYMYYMHMYMYMGVSGPSLLPILESIDSIIEYGSTLYVGMAPKKWPPIQTYGRPDHQNSLCSQHHIILRLYMQLSIRPSIHPLWKISENDLTMRHKRPIEHQKLELGDLCEWQSWHSVASPGGFQGFLETSRAPTIACSTVQLARYSLGATAQFMLIQHWRQVRSANLTLELQCACSDDDVIIMNMIKRNIFAACFARPIPRNYSVYFQETPLALVTGTSTSFLDRLYEKQVTMYTYMQWPADS